MGICHLDSNFALIALKVHLYAFLLMFAVL